MITKDPKFQNVIGWAKGFSETDIVQINKMYQCGKYPYSFFRENISRIGSSTQGPLTVMQVFRDKI